MRMHSIVDPFTHCPSRHGDVDRTMSWTASEHSKKTRSCSSATDLHILCFPDERQAIAMGIAQRNIVRIVIMIR
jgi:hypothetical protein